MIIHSQSNPNIIHIHYETSVAKLCNRPCKGLFNIKLDIGPLVVRYRHNFQLRQTYKRELKQLMIDQRFHNHPKRKKKAKAAARRIKVIAGKIYRDLYRRLDDGQKGYYLKLFKIFDKVLEQQKDGKRYPIFDVASN